MWIRCSAVSVLLLAGCDGSVATVRQPTAPAAPSPVVASLDESKQPADPARVALDVGGKRMEIAVTVDRATIGQEGPRDVSVLAQRGALVVVVDSYGSRAQGLRRCQAGQEIYARVIDAKAGREHYAKLVESCLKSVQSGDPAMTIAGDGPSVDLSHGAQPRRTALPGGRSVTFHLLQEPAVTLSLDANGTFSAGPAAKAPVVG